MTIFSIILTAINVILTGISVFCTIRSSRQTEFQTEIMRQQLKNDQKPDYPITLRLDFIKESIYSVSRSINQLAEKEKY